MYTYRLDAVKDESFLTENRHDPVTQAPFAVGQMIVVCAKCRAVYAQTTWSAMNNRCALCTKAGEATPTLPIQSTADLVVHMSLQQAPARHFSIRDTSKHPAVPAPYAANRSPVYATRPAVPMYAPRRGGSLARALRRIFRLAVVATIIGSLYFGTVWLSGEVVSGALDMLPGSSVSGLKTAGQAVLRFHNGVLDFLRSFGLPIVAGSEVHLNMARAAPASIEPVPVDPEVTEEGSSDVERTYLSTLDRSRTSELSPLEDGQGLRWKLEQGEEPIAHISTIPLNGEYENFFTRLQVQPGWPEEAETPHQNRYRIVIRARDANDKIRDSWRSGWTGAALNSTPIQLDVTMAQTLEIEFRIEGREGAMAEATFYNAYLE